MEFFFVRMKPGDPAIALEVLNRTWKNIVADLPFKYDFLDDNLNNLYRSEIRLSDVIGWAAGISLSRLPWIIWINRPIRGKSHKRNGDPKSADARQGHCAIDIKRF